MRQSIEYLSIVVRFQKFKSTLAERIFLSRSSNQPRIRKYITSQKMTGLFRKMPSGKAYLQVLGANTIDTTPSLLLFTDSQRYIFNCGEGTQRLFNEHKIKFSKINNIFLTQICWEYIGGLPGMAMTLRDNGRCSLSVYGPENLSEFIKATRFFLHKEKLHFDCVGFSGSEEQKFEDENVTIWPVILTAGKGTDEEVSHVTSQDESEDSDIKEDDTDCANGVSHVRKKRKSNTGIQVSVSYICQLADLPGKFLPKKALELGVPKGPLFGELKQGEVVTLENGVEVKPEDVMEPKQPGPIFMIIDCPSVEHIPSLTTNKRFLMFQPQKEIIVTLMIHVTPVDVFKTTAYQDWIESFGTEVQHLLFAKTQNNEPVFQRQYRIQCKLHTVDPRMFPLLYSSDNLEDVSKNVTIAENFNIFHLRPLKQQGFDNSDIPPRLNSVDIMKESRQLLGNMLGNTNSISGNECSCSACQEAFNSMTKKNVITDDMTEFNNEVLDSFSTERTIKSTENEITGFAEAEYGKRSAARDCKASNKPSEENASIDNYNNFDKEIESGTKNEITNFPWNDRKGAVSNGPQQTCTEPICSDLNFEVVFIGTGAALPSKYRNVSSTLVSISDKSLLLDCGEGTYGQLYRHYGNQVDDVIQRLSCVFISHIHADHHLGLVQILIKRQILLKGSERSEEPLLVIGPKWIKYWLSEYDTLCQSLHYSFIDSSLMTSQGHKWKDKFELLLNAKEIVTVPVDHCVQAYGLVWRHTSGCSIVYSGDARPSDDLVQAGAGATVLIHEATFEDELKAEALEKKHSTTTEAINVGIQMKAKLIMLNHFSQRYPKIPVFNEQFTDCTGIAFDHMRISSNDFERIPKLLEPLKVLFAEEMEELSNKTR